MSDLLHQGAVVNDHLVKAQVAEILKGLQATPTADMKSLTDIWPVVRPLLTFWAGTLPAYSPALIPLQHFIAIVDNSASQPAAQSQMPM